MKKILFLLSFCLFTGHKLGALSVTLPRVGYVDINKVFENYVTGQKAREDLIKEAGERESAVRKKEEEIRALEEEIEKEEARSPEVVQPWVVEASTDNFSLETATATASQPAVIASTSTLDLIALPIKKDTLEKKKKELEEFRQSAERQLTAKSVLKTEEVLRKIQQAIKSVAQDGQFSAVLDKNSVLYGEGGVDLTGKVLEELGLGE